MSHRRLAITIAALFITLFTTAAIATTPDPATYFTANLPPPRDPTAVTALEQALLDRLTAATTTVDAAIYDFDRPTLRDALLTAHTRGVTIRVVTDDESRATDAAFYTALTTAGIPVVDDADATRIMHDKYAIIDGATVWTGSTNWSVNDLTKNHNNAIVFTDPAVAAAYENDFTQMFSGHFGAAKTPSPTTAFTYAGHLLELYFAPQDGALDQVIAEVDAAQQTIDFAIFFFTDDRLRDALVAANARGVAIRGLFDELGAANASSADEALCLAGAAVKVADTPGKMHNKLMVIDAAGPDPRVITGSLNWSAAGDRRNSENTAIPHDPTTAQTYAAAFAQLWAAINPATQCNAAPPPGPAALYLPLARRGPAAATPEPTPTSVPAAPCACTGDLYNCSDFPTHAAAQTCFDWCMQEVGTDVHHLDADGDGLACESLPLGWRVVWEDGSW